MSPPIRGLLFDLGSTLWQKIAVDSWQSLEAEADARAGTLLCEYAAGTGARRADSIDPVSLGAALRGSPEWPSPRRIGLHPMRRQTLS